MKRKVMAIFLATVMALGLAACGGTAENVSETAPADAEDSAEVPDKNESTAVSESTENGEGKTFKIGMMIGLTGANAALGVDGRDAVQLYLDQVNYTIGDYKIDLIVEDDEAGADGALTKAKKLVEMDKVDLLLGPHAAAGAYALLPYIEEVKVPLYIPGASGDDVTMRQASQYAVRTGTTSSQPMFPLGSFCYTDLGYETGAIISYDNSYGWEIAGGFQQGFENEGGKIVYRIFVPVGTQDFSPYISQIPVDKVDFLFFNLSGADSVRMTSQLADYGLAGELPIVAGATPCDEATLDQLNECCVGFYSALAYAATLDTPANKDFVSSFEEAYGRKPGFVAEQYYTGMLFLAAALENCEDPYDALTLINTISETKVDNAPRGPVTIDDYGNVIHNVYIRKVEVVDGVRQNTVVKTYENVSQFWTFDPEEFLKQPSYSAEFPEISK